MSVYPVLRFRRSEKQVNGSLWQIESAVQPSWALALVLYGAFTTEAAAGSEPGSHQLHLSSSSRHSPFHFSGRSGQDQYDYGGFGLPRGRAESIPNTPCLQQGSSHAATGGR